MMFSDTYISRFMRTTRTVVATAIEDLYSETRRPKSNSLAGFSVYTLTFQQFQDVYRYLMCKDNANLRNILPEYVNTTSLSRALGIDGGSLLELLREQGFTNSLRTNFSAHVIPREDAENFIRVNINPSDIENGGDVESFCDEPTDDDLRGVEEELGAVV